jgi:uncharacterized protein YndB with AHSA1/START domain
MNSEVKISGNRLQLTRFFSAPRKLVFSYWAQADKLQQWSGCKETTKCEVQMDFRPGGRFTQKMNIAGVGEYIFAGIYDEIVEPERIVYHADLGPAPAKVVVEFIEQGDQTKVVLTQHGFPDENLCKIVSQGTSEGLDKLERLLHLAEHSALR